MGKCFSAKPLLFFFFPISDHRYGKFRVYFRKRRLIRSSDAGNFATLYIRVYVISLIIHTHARIYNKRRIDRSTSVRVVRYEKIINVYLYRYIHIYKPAVYKYANNLVERLISPNKDSSLSYKPNRARRSNINGGVYTYTLSCI